VITFQIKNKLRCLNIYIFVVGDRGDGKTLTATRFACEAQKSITNFPIFQKNIKRLKVQDVFKSHDPDAKAQKDKWRTNWDFWTDKKGFSVFVDEAYMQFENRSPHDIKNKIWNSWGAQSRKILGNQGKARDLKRIFKLPNKAFMTLMPVYINSLSNFWMLSQTVRRVDVNQRELVNVLITCEQSVIFGREVTINRCWYSDKFNDAINKMMSGERPKTFYTDNKNWYGLYDTDYFSREVDIENGEAYL